ncbi:hypothetical protein [Caldichromatium japonicum]|nr:hypothetical protein [Caldichromatium japonicum]
MEAEGIERLDGWMITAAQAELLVEQTASGRDRLRLIEYAG